MEKISAKYVDDLIDEDEIPELTEEDFKRFRPFSELPENLQATLRAIQSSPAATRQTIALPPDVLEPFRARGEGWERVVEGVLRDWLRDHAA